MHDQVVTIPTSTGEPVSLLYTHAAFLALSERSDLSIADAYHALERVDVVAIERVLQHGLEGHRERAGGRAKAWSRADVQELLAGPLYQHSYPDLVPYLVDALSRGARRGKAQTPDPTGTAPPAS